MRPEMFPLRNSLYFGTEREIIYDGHVCVERIALRKIAYLPLDAAGIPVDAVLTQAHIPRGGGHVTGDDLHRGALASPVRTQKTYHLPGLYLKRYLAYRSLLPVTLYQIFYNYRHSLRPNDATSQIKRNEPSLNILSIHLSEQTHPPLPARSTFRVQL